ncbi:MAG: type II CAAX endopeptidase family protein [Nocardioides alkalitolerans]
MSGTSPYPPVPMSEEERAAAYPPLEYHQLHRAGDRGWWRPVLGVLAVLVGMQVVLPLGVLAVFALGLGATGVVDVDTIVDTEDVQPVTLAYLMVSLALLTPLVWGVTRLLHGLKPRWTTSVLPRMRWGFFLACMAVSLVALLASMVMSVVVTSVDPNALPGDSEVGGLNAFTSTTRDFLLVVVLLTPLQAAGEEYLFRGYLTQVAGGIFERPEVARTVAVVVPALLFALAHGAQDPPVFFDRFAFGLAAGVLVILTGGLEAGIALHVMNNWFAFGLALAFGDMSTVLTPTGGSWLSIPVTLTQELVFLGLALAVHRGMRLSRHADSAVLIRSRGRVYGFASAPQGP